MSHTVAAPAKVLVTGANGFMATWIIRLLLEQGYSVRGTVRSAAKGQYLKTFFEFYGDKFEYAVVSNMTTEGAFDEAVRGVDAVLHTAAPVTFSGTVDEVIKPAIEGISTVFNSVQRVGNKVRRVVITSTAGAIMDPHEPPYTYTESEWNDEAVRQFEAQGESSPGQLLYYAAKTLAEKVAWDWVAKHKGEMSWDLVALNPPYVFGPSLREETSMGSNWVVGGLQQKRSETEAGAFAGVFVDVRDIALAHILSLQNEAAGGERLIISGGPFAWQDIYDQLNSVTPALPNIPKGYPGVKRAVGLALDSSKAARILGLTKYHSLLESTRDAVIGVTA